MGQSAQELPALFVAPDRAPPRWIAWTPEGYYDGLAQKTSSAGTLTRAGRKKRHFSPLAASKNSFTVPAIAKIVLEASNSGAMAK
jgi:hypothetical protein